MPFLLQFVLWTFVLVSHLVWADDPQSCPSPMNKIVQENLLPGDPSTEWDINGAGDPTIQGFATESSIHIGEVIDFKVKTDSQDYRADIYRLGYYGGMGARRIDTIQPFWYGSQPDCRYDAATHEVDCDNWNVSLSWRVFPNATSGVYLCRLVRHDGDPNWRMDHSQLHWDARFSRPYQHANPLDPPPLAVQRGRGRMRNALLEPRASHIVFVVRDDEAPADILIQTMDTTYHAYNCWGSLNTYGFPCSDARTQAGSPQYQANTTTGPSRAYHASLNRPMATRAYRAVNFVFNSEYPLIRWMERNGYHVTYWSGVDTHRYGHVLASKKYMLFISQGHDEYWSKEQRRHVTAARNAGVHLAFLSGNEVYWKIRYENNFHTMVVYKDTQEVEQRDPVEWTGTWRDDRSINPLGGQPENELTGTLFTVNAWRHDALEVPSKYRRHRFWRHTRVADMRDEKEVLLSGLLGHEWDEDIDNGYRPAGLQRLSETTIDNVQYLMDEGSVFDSATATHHLVLYHHSSGALVFGAGTCQWAWGLDEQHDSTTGVPPERRNAYNIRIGRDQQGPDRTIQQATVNLLADMEITAATLQPDLVSTPPSNDTIPPQSTITNCQVMENVDRDLPWRIMCTGVASDAGGGVVSAVEVSVDARWHPADMELTNATTSFSYCYESATTNVNFLSRAVDDSGNLEEPPSAFSGETTTR